jgi:uncharacterized membrane protein
MNEAHVHLLVNHFPIIVPIIGLLVMLGGLYFRSETIKRTAYVIFIFGAISTIPAFLTGEGAEEVVEKIQGIDKSFIETHEEIADIFNVLSYILGGVSFFGIWASIKQKSFSNTLAVITILFSLIVLFFAAKTGTTGGEIRHTEIRAGLKVPKE